MLGDEYLQCKLTADEGGVVDENNERKSTIAKDCERNIRLSVCDVESKSSKLLRCLPKLTLSFESFDGTTIKFFFVFVFVSVLELCHKKVRL